MKSQPENLLQSFLLNANDGDTPDFLPLIPGEPSSINDNTDELPETVSVLALKNTVIFPDVVIPISVGRQKSIKLIKDALAGSRIIGVVAQIDAKKENPSFDDIYHVGTLAQIVKMLEMPDGSTTVVIQGKHRMHIDELIAEDPYFEAKITISKEQKLVGKQSDEFEALVASLKELSIKIIDLSSNIPSEAAFAVKNIENATFLINFIASNSDVDLTEKQKLLEEDDLYKRGLLLLEYLTRELQKLEIKDDIQAKVKQELDQQQREYFLNQQIKAIQEELGGNPSMAELEELKKQAKTKKWNENIAELFAKELEKVKRSNPASPEYSIQLNYLQALLDLPWNEQTKDNFDLKRALKVLDKEHFGLEKVKDRILEHLAILKLKGDLKSPILCLYGPPGVGKTSLGKSVAKALGRKYVRMALGGLHDEAEIRGHRKTYIGAMPGRIIQNLRKAKSSNPVFVLDEIDKLGSDFRGDPSFALLEVLDPEQNSAFHDNYLDVDYDLSKILFIATANDIASIKPALRDRMEIINVTGYVLEEKVEIAKRHLIPKQLEIHGVKKNQVKFAKPVIEKIIESYTSESGVRELNNRIAKVVRNIARKIGFEEEYNPNLSISEAVAILGPEPYSKDKYQGNSLPGVVTGLAWTSHGGEILFVETSLSSGKGSLTLTGNLGNVMKESATIALEYIKANAEKLGVPSDIFEQKNIHIHIPEGAIPKDGPSAGITMVCCLISAFTKRKVKHSIAMTGEITLRGKILAVGGIKEKILAAKRANIKEIVLPRENKKNVEDIKPLYINGLTFHYVENIMEAVDIVLLNEKVK